jgi:succinylarginine dihydrolase
VFKDYNSEVVSDVFKCLDEHLVKRDPAAALRVLEQMGRLPNFGFMTMMLSPPEKAAIARVLDASGADAEKVEALKAKYQC